MQFLITRTGTGQIIPRFKNFQGIADILPDQMIHLGKGDICFYSESRRAFFDFFSTVFGFFFGWSERTVADFDIHG